MMPYLENTSYRMNIMSLRIKFKSEFVLFDFLNYLLDESKLSRYSIDALNIKASAVDFEYCALNSQSELETVKRGH